ncbi:MAG: LysM peptidoglycan-binding domain-containing protein [Anaerolineales bacterium]
MSVTGRHLATVGLVCVLAMLPMACVRSKPARELPPASTVFGASRQALSAPSPTPPTLPTPTTAEGLVLEPTNTPAAALMIVAATATAVALSGGQLAPTQPSAQPVLTPTLSTAVETGTLQTYVVAEGETLYSIATRHGVTVAELQAVNGLGTSTHIEAGQTLFLPAHAQLGAGPIVETTDYWVARGETLSEIARRYRTTVEDILAANPNLSDQDQIYVGMHLIVPVGTAPQRTHRVQAGESLSSIAEQYGVTTRSIVQANGLHNANQIYVGQVLVIP